MTSCSIAHQVPLSMEFSRQEYYSGYPFPSPGYLPNPGIKYGVLALQADSLPSEPLCYSTSHGNLLSFIVKSDPGYRFLIDNNDQV